jgi:FkbM family methyltransferase
MFLKPAKHIYKLLFDKEYRNHWLLEARLRNTPRFTDCHASVYDWTLSIPDSASFLSSYREIFSNQIYAFRFNGDRPKILDLGANIGLSVLYFKKLYPLAQITAFEADPDIFKHLVKNVHGNGYTDVQLINKAVWHENTTLKFCSEGADGGRAALPGDDNLIEVAAIDIAEYLRGNQFDLLKMDIEGAEEIVLPACKDYLEKFKFIFVEYHSKINRKQCLDKILHLISEAGFRIHLHSVVCSPSPFIEIRVNSGFDLQLDIFGWKE